MTGSFLSKLSNGMLRNMTLGLGAPLVALGLFATPADARQSYRGSKPPGNVAGDDYAKLLGGAVFVSNPVNTRPKVYNIQVHYVGRDGRFVFCVPETGTTKYMVPKSSRWKVRRYIDQSGDMAVPVLANGRDLSGNNVGLLMPVYDGRTGAMRWYTPDRKRWWRHSDGHLQKRLPRAVWTVCPDFPSAKSLGVGINEKQTAVTYRELVKQDRGQRILRPDLVTPNPIECRDPQTGTFSLCKGRK